MKARSFAAPSHVPGESHPSRITLRKMGGRGIPLAHPSTGSRPLQLEQCRSFNGGGGKVFYAQQEDTDDDGGGNLDSHPGDYCPG